MKHEHHPKNIKDQFPFSEKLMGKEFDDICQLALYISKASACYISLVHQDHLYCIYQNGKPVPSSLHDAFGRYVANNPKNTLLVVDSRQDKRFQQIPAVRSSPSFVFYAGIPLMDTDGKILGVMSITDHQPKHLDAKQIEALNKIGRQAVRLLTLLPEILTSSKSKERSRKKGKGLSHSPSAEEQLQLSEQRFRSLVQDGSDLIAILDGKANYKYVSPTSASILGIRPDSFIGRNAFEFIHPNDFRIIQQEFSQLSNQKRVKSSPYRFQHKNGGWRWLRSVGTNLLEDDAVAGIVINSVDITDLITTQEALQKSNERFEYINKATNDAIYDWNVVDDIFYWGDSFQRIFGHQMNETVFSLKDWVALMHPTDKVKHQESWEEFMQNPSTSKWTQQYRFKRSDGSYAFVEEIGHMIRDQTGTPLRMIGTLRDISQQKLDKTQKQILAQVSLFFKSEESLEKILDQVLIYLSGLGEYELAEIWLLSPSNSHLHRSAQYAKSAFSSSFYQEAKQTEQLPLGQGLPGRVWENKKTEVWDHISQSKDFVRREAALKSGLRSVMGIPLFYHRGFVGVLVLCSTLPAQQLHSDKVYFETLKNFLGGEIKRKQQEEELHLLFQSAPEILAIASPFGYFTKVNPAFCELMGYTVEELTNRPFTDFLHPEDIANTSAEYDETITGERHANNFINRYRTKSGNYRWISWSSSKVIGKEGYVFAFGRDITEMKELQDLLKNASRLARVGSWEVNIKDGQPTNCYWSEMTREILEVDPKYPPSLTDGLGFCEEESKHKIQRAVEELISKGKEFDLELLLTTGKSNPKWIRSIGHSERVNGKCVKIFGSFQDIHTRKTAELELAKKTEYLAVLAEIISHLLKFDDWYKALKEAFIIIGETMSIDRVYYFENHTDTTTGEILSSQRFKWTNDGTEPQISNPHLQNISLDNFKGFSELSNGQPVINITSKIEDGEVKGILEEKNIKSCLILPIVVKGDFFGFIGLDDCQTEREWSESEVYFLKNVTSNLSSAIQRTKSQAAIEKSFKEKNQILESIGDAFFTVDRDFTVTYWNHMAEALLQTPRETILGENLWDIFTDAHDLPSFQNYRRAMEKMETVQFEDYYAPINRWFGISAYPSENGLTVYFRDITASKLAEEQIRQSNERFEILAQATNDAIWDFNPVDGQLFWGNGFLTLFGQYPQQEKPTFDFLISLIHPEDRARIVQKMEAYMQTPKLTNWFEEYRFLKGDGQYAHVMDRAIFLKNEQGEVSRVIGAMTDITYRIEAEESLKKLNESLEIQAKELATSNAELEQFAYVASHDLQEPLRMVSAFLSQLEKKYNHLLDEKGLQYIGFAVDGAKRMQQIILSLLNFSRVGKQDSQMELLSINEMVEDVCHLQRKRIEECGAVISYRKLPKITSYRSPLFQIFQNLIGNALKYTKEGVTPKVNIKATERKKDWLISVHDNGIGISPEYFDKIFIIFQRLHAKNEYSGTGMGLSIVKKLVENLGGKIWVESEEGKWSTFYFTLLKQDKDQRG